MKNRTDTLFRNEAIAAA